MEWILEKQTEDYRGYLIVVTPIKDHDDLWDFKYRITKAGDPQAALIGHSSSRRQTMGGHQTPAAACEAGVEVARIEVDNHIALVEK